MTASGSSFTGILLVLAVMLPFTGVMLAMVLGGRLAERVVQGLMPVVLLVAVGIAVQVGRGMAPLQYFMGGWAPPLGVAFRADGLSAVMLVTTSVVIGAIALFARPVFLTPEGGAEVRTPEGGAEVRTPEGGAETRMHLVFWTMLIAVWGALNVVWLSGDLFTLYVALELLTFAAVPLVCLDGKAETLRSALRYLLFALVGSVLYLLGVILLYGAYGTLDLVQLGQRIHPQAIVWVAGALMTAGLLAKTALFPLHLWLPPAHAGAPAAASALLSALVVKGSFFLVVRLWFGVLPPTGFAAGQILGVLGSCAIVFGSVMALRQARLKLLVAYSTVAQIGYLFFLFPLVSGSAQAWAGVAWTGGMMQVVAHAVAKAAMFMAAGLIGEALGHDRIAGFGGLGRVLPMTVVAFGISGMSLMGLPPSGGFVAKAMLLSASVGEGQWWWAVVIVVGGLLAAGYVFRVLFTAMRSAGPAPELRKMVSRQRETVVLALAVGALLLGLVPLRPLAFLGIGQAEIAAVQR